MQAYIPTKVRTLSPKQYLAEVKKNSVVNNIDSVKFIPPQIGKGGFGQFLVHYKTPVLVER